MSKTKAIELGISWFAEIGAHSMVAGPDSSLQLQPANAITATCDKAGITPADLDLVEINEAIAAVGASSTRALGLDPERVNVDGGAIAIGHPLGASGARIALHWALELKCRVAWQVWPRCAVKAAKATRSSCTPEPRSGTSSSIGNR